MHSEQDRADLAERSVVVLRGTFGPVDAARMRRRVWARLATAGVAEDDPSTSAASNGHPA